MKEIRQDLPTNDWVVVLHEDRTGVRNQTPTSSGGVLPSHRVYVFPRIRQELVSRRGIKGGVSMPPQSLVPFRPSGALTAPLSVSYTVSLALCHLHAGSFLSAFLFFPSIFYIYFCVFVHTSMTQTDNNLEKSVSPSTKWVPGIQLMSLAWWQVSLAVEPFCESLFCFSLKGSCRAKIGARAPPGFGSQRPVLNPYPSVWPWSGDQMSSSEG